jgi:phospholipase C
VASQQPRCQAHRPSRVKGPPPSGQNVPLDFDSVIQDIVFIIKENRSFDQMFGTFPGATGATSGTISTGQVLPLGVTPDAGPRDISHSWVSANEGIDYGRMDHFDQIFDSTTNGDYLCMTQQNQTTIPNYWSYASSFTLLITCFLHLRAPVSQSSVHDCDPE